MTERTMPSAPETSTGFRELMATFPTGVTVVTAMAPDGRPWGMTCSSVCSVTLRPPTLLVCLRRGSPTLSAALRTSEFAVNLLHDGARETAQIFASGDQDRFSRVRWERGLAGPHLTADAHAIADCQVVRTVELGDHLVLFGEVFGVEHRQPRPPLLYGLRSYSAWPTAPA